MSSTALATTRPEDQAKEKSRLLHEALARIAELGLELDLSAGIERILIHIVSDRALDRADARSQAKSQAIAVVTINLGLEYATKGDADKAVQALTRNAIETIFLIGKKLSDELLVRVQTVWKQAVIDAGTALPCGAYGVTDKETEAQLMRWMERGVSDHAFLPIGTMDEWSAVTGVLDRVERETVLARKVQWSEVFADYGTSRFTADVFRREAKLTANPLGGIWKPFLLSLITQAMTGGWERNQRRVAFVDREAIVEFVELVTFEFHRLNERASLAAERIAEIAMQKGIFKTACSRAEVEEMFRFAQAWMEELSTEAKAFCFAAEDLDAVTDADVDRFWRTRLFLSSNVPYNVRMAESGEPWKRLPKATTLAALKLVLKDFSHWPADEQERALDTLKLDPLIDAVTGVEKQAEELYALPITVELATRTITWTNRAGLLMAMRHHARHDRFKEVTRAVAALVQWNYARIKGLFGSIDRELIAIAIRAADPPLTTKDWEDASARASNDCGLAVMEVWSAMDELQQHTTFMGFTARSISGVMVDWPLSRVETFFRKVIGEMQGDRASMIAFRRWYQGETTGGMHFVVPERWVEPLEALLKELLGWKTTKELRVEGLPTGHPDRRALDLVENRERIEALAADRPWTRVATVDSFDGLRVLLTNFVLWPAAEQDGLCFAGHQFDGLLDTFKSVTAQGDAVASLRAAMKSPYQEAGTTDLALYKLFRWEHRAALVADLCGRRRITSNALILVAKEIPWPVQAIATIEKDPVLMAIALERMATPASDRDWETACAIARDSNLATAKRIWERMPEQRRQAMFMRFPPAYVSEFFLGRPWEEVQALFLPILEARGADADFQRDFKRWFTDQSKLPKRFILQEAWVEPFWALVGERLNWVRPVTPARKGLSRDHRHAKMLDELQKTDPPPTLKQWESAAIASGYYHTEFGRAIWRLMPLDVRRRLFMKIVASMVSAELQETPWEEVRAFFDPILTEKAKDGNFKRRFAIWYHGDGSPIGNTIAFHAPEAWKKKMEDLLREHNIQKPRPRRP